MKKGRPASDEVDEKKKEKDEEEGKRRGGEGMGEVSEIFQKMPKIMACIGHIGKDKKNPQQGYKFRGIDDVYNAVHAKLSEHGVFCVPQVLTMQREERKTAKGSTLLYTILEVKYTFYASDGSSVEAQVVGEAMDSGDKSCNKAMSAAQKYAFLQIFCIPTEEAKDTENETHEVVDQKAAKSSGNSDFLKVMEGQKARVGERVYHVLLGANGYDEADQITDRDHQTKIYKALAALPDK